MMASGEIRLSPTTMRRMPVLVQSQDSMQSQNSLFQSNNALDSNFFTTNGGLPTEPGLQGVDYFITQLIGDFLDPQPTYVNGVQANTGMPPGVLSAGGFQAMSDAALAEAIAGGTPFTAVTVGYNPMNFSAQISSAEAEANLLSNGFSVVGTTSTGGNYLSNGTSFYSFYSRTSNGAYGMIYNGNVVKYNLTGP